MKQNLCLSLLFLLLSYLPSRAQEPTPHFLELTHHKTTSLVFPFAIKSVDRGTQDVLARIPDGLPHVLQVKATRPGIGETNLTVFTADGRLHIFEVRYAAHPLRQHLVLPAAPQPASWQAIAADLVEDERFYYGIRSQEGKVRATLEGIYIHGSTLYFRLVLHNASPLPYELDFYRFSVRDRKQARRTARQEVQLQPLYVEGDRHRHLPAGQRQVIVFALDKFTVSRDKELQLGLFEAQGDRHLFLRIRAGHLLRACPIYLRP